MTKSVVGLFDSFGEAQQAVDDLVSNGFARDDISVLASRATREAAGVTEGDDAVAEGAAVGATSGALIGGAAGLIASLSALTVPVVGPILAAGPLLATLVGMGAGAVVGGLIGALVEAGVPEDEAKLYEEGVRRGGTLVLVRTTEERAFPATDILDRHNAVDIRTRAAVWQADGDVTPSAATPPPIPASTGAPFDAPHLAGGPQYQGQAGESMARRKDEAPAMGSAQPGEGRGPAVDEAEFRRHCQTAYGPEASYPEYCPAYEYGSYLAKNQTYAGKDWASMQSEARRVWETNHPNTWDRMKDAIQYGWHKAKSKVS